MRRFWESHSDSVEPLQTWHKEVSNELWSSPNQVKAFASSASILFLAELSPFFLSKPGDAAFARCMLLCELIEACEDVHYPMREPSPEAIAEYEREKRGVAGLVAA